MRIAAKVLKKYQQQGSMTGPDRKIYVAGVFVGIAGHMAKFFILLAKHPLSTHEAGRLFPPLVDGLQLSCYHL